MCILQCLGYCPKSYVRVLTQSNTLTIAREKAAKALKEKGETPEELLRSIKENEAAVAEAQRVVAAWKAIVGEKSRREEAFKAEVERIERKAAEERERAEAEEKTRIEAEKKEAERIAAEKAEEEARVEAERKAEEERKTKEEERKERDENGQPFVVSSDGTTTFGEITEDTGLTAAPIKLSEGVADEMGNGYGLRHIEARHGDQIRKAGFSSVEEFIEQVAKNYDVIKEGSDRNGNKTYRLLLTDKHNNTLMIELSKDGSYWNVNTAGVFKKSYGKDKKEVYNRHTTVKQSAETAETSQADEHSGTQSTSRMNVPTTSTDKGSEKAEKKQKKQSVFDKAKEIADKEEKKRKAEDDSVLGQATRAVGKKKKVNPFKYTASQKDAGEVIKGVHYANGYAYASDGYILFKEKADYPKEWEGTTRDKDGNLIDGKYPDAEKAIHRLVHIPDKEVESLPSKGVLDFAIAASKKLKGEAIPVSVDGIFFNAVNLKKFLEAVASKGMDKIVYRHPMLYATNGKDEIVMMPTVNTLEGALDIADRMERAGLPEEQIDAWKAHIEAADKKMSFDDFKKAVENAKKEGVRPTEADKQESKAEAEKQKVDKQGNPIDAEGRLITEKVEDISDLSDDDFNNPTRSVELPKIPKNVDDALGANGRPVIIKKNIFEKNGKSHGFTPKQSRKILGDALYNPDIVGQSQPSTKKTHWVAIKVDEKSPITILEVNDGKDNVEVVGWYTLDARNLERIKRQAEREGGELLVLSPKDKVESLPTPTSGLPTDKGSEVGGEKQEAEKKRPAPLSERIEDVGEKIGDARKDVWKEIIARIKNKKQGIEEALKKSSAGKLFSSLFDEKELLESGVSNEVVTFISAVKGSLGTKPRSLSKLKMWINKVLHQYDMCEQALENWESVKKKIDEWKYYSQPFYMYRAAMAVGGYESGRDVGNAELWQIADGYSDGKSVAGQWCVRKAGAYDGIYKTYEEAAEALKKFAGENAAVDGKGKRKEVKLAIYKRRTDGTMFIAPEGKPDVIIQDGFKTLYEASAYKKEHYAEMQERYRTLMDGIKPKFNENRERKGRDWRGGKNVSAEDFREAFDFRGVEFGNWMQQKDRRQALNECYDSLMDLAMVCGVSPKALSLGGKLAMAFGARGVGKFNAHYEPDKVVINLTKTKGAGSLAHEWFHAIDNYFNMQGWDEFATESTRNVERKEMAEAWKDLVRAINGSDYFKRSDKYARLKGSRYWIEPTELGARAFAVWVENRLSKYGTINDYLANNPRLVDEKASDAEKKYAPYPFDKDADWMDEKFGRLFEVMQERVDEETGKHILYSRNKAAGHENTELTAEERELRDNLVERMRKGGLDVVTDSEEMQRVIDTENERTRMMGAGSVREHRVYHGSGADFDAFDHSHMGEGEGAQAYGWGTYVTEVEGIGRTYANATAHNYNNALRPLERKKDSILTSLRINGSELDKARAGLRNAVRFKTKENYEEFLRRREEIEEKYGKHSTQYDDYLWNSPYAAAVRAIEHYENEIKERETELHSLQKDLEETRKQIENIEKEFPHHLYTVEIPDDNGGNYLDWNGHPAESLLKDVGSFLEGEGFERVQDNPARYEKGESTVVLNPNATGADLYAELREALGSDKKASQALAELGCIGIKYPADNMRGGRKDGAKNYVIFNENDAKITDHTRFLRTADGEVYGLVKDGRIYLDPKVATAETAVHEYTHLWGDMLRRKDSEQWSHTVKELKDSVLWEEVKELYPELKTDDEIADEVLSTFSGRRGAERLREEARRVADGEGGVFTKAKAIETLERVKEAIARFWEGVARMFGINRYRSAEELADMAMKDLLNGVKPTSRTFTFDNFYKDTKAVFEGTERPKGKPDYISYSGSEYWYGEDKGGKYVVRGSDHWSGEFKVKDGERTNVGRNHYSEITEDGMLPIGAQGSLKFGWKKGLSKPVGSGISAAIDRRGSGDSNNIASCYWYIDNAKEKDNKGFTYGKAYLSEFEDKERRRDIPGDDWRDIQGVEGNARAMRSDEIDRKYPDWLDGTTTDSGRHSTQVEGTRRTYNKVGDWIEKNIGKDAKILDASSGLGYGTADLKKRGFNIEDVEPYQSEERKKNNPATYSSYDDIPKDYDVIISNAVLNVIPDNWRSDVLHNMADHLKPGGIMFINTRKAGEERSIKDKIELDSPQEVLVKRNGKIASYQRFFAPKELKEWVEKELGNGYEVETANDNNSGTKGLAAVVVKKSDADIDRSVREFSPMELSNEDKQRRGDALRKAEPIDVKIKQIVKTKDMSARKAAEKWWKDNVGTSRFYDTEIGLVEINRASVGSSLAHRYSQAKLDAITSLVDGFNNAVYLGSMQDFSRQEGVKNHYFAYPINYNGYRNYVFCRAMQDANKNRLYVHEVFLADNIEKGNTLQTAAFQPHGGITLYKDILANVLTANIGNNSEPSKPRYSRKPGESIFDYASRVSEDVDRSVRERVSARDEYEKKVKSKGFQTKEALQNSMLGLQEFMSAIDHASGNRRYIEDIPDFENPILGENRLSSVNKEEMHQVAKTQFKPLMSAVAKLSGNGKESGELYDYMFAKHGLERDAVMRQREAQKEFDKYQKANPKGTKTIGDFVASLEGKDYAGLTALTAEDGRVKSIQSQIDTIDEQMEVTDNQLLLHYLGGQKKRLKVDLLNAARDAADDIRKAFESNPSHDRSDINELWSRVNEVNGNTLRKLYESGMLTKEAYNDISSMYTNYIPMRGFDQTTSADAYAYLTHGDSAFNAPIKTAKGRSSRADNPIAYMQAMAESAIMQGNRNVLVKQKMLNFVRNHPSDLASVSDVWLQYDSVADEWKPFYAFGRESKG